MISSCMPTNALICTLQGMSSPFVTQLDLSVCDKLKSLLQSQGFSFSTPPYTVFQAKKEHLTCTLYHSGKLVVTGSKKDEFILYTLEPEILGTFTYGKIDETARIGVDESGKGDYFGPLCIAAVFAAENTLHQLVSMGVKDSKKLTDDIIIKLSEKIEKQFPHTIVRINPAKYNLLYEQFGNLNLLLGWGHATAIDELLAKVSCDKVIIDQFAAEHVVERALARKKRSVNLTQRTKAEEDPVVAAASILARAAFVKGLDKLAYTVDTPPA